MQVEEAIKEMKHWIEYEKANKDKIKRADELIEIQETVLQELDVLKLKERNRVLGNLGEIEVHELINKVLLEDYVPKEAMEEKIKELKEKEKEEINGLKGQDRYFVKQIYQAMRKSLEELLEEK